jgi:Zn-dependent peptidase ImmA (M78 family)
LRNQIEKTGVIVMMNGIVGQNTHRILNLKEFRAFALMDLYAPLIFINRQDSYTGMIFSLIHEFIHLLLDNDDIILNESYEEKNNIERTINSYVAEFLMPTHYLKTVWKKDYDAIKQIGDISRTLNVSQSALVIKLCELSLVNDKIVNQIFAITNTNVMHKKSKGGNYYSTLSSRISNSFSQAVINQTESGSLRYTDAYRLLGINGKTYQQFKEYKEIHRLTNE